MRVVTVLLDVRRALRAAFADRASRVAFFAVSVLFFVAAILLLVVTIPGNTLPFQLSIFTRGEYALLIVLAVLAGFQGAFQVSIWRAQRRSHAWPRAVVQGTFTGVSGLSAFFAAALGTAACSACLATLFGLLGVGTGTLFFIVERRTIFLVGAVAIMLLSLTMAARRMLHRCPACEGVGDPSHSLEYGWRR